jgi:Sec-independent protein secretion pathway component TatC
MKDQKNNFNALEKYVKYSGMAFQMGIIIFLFVWAGKKIDEKFMDGRRIFIIIFSLIGVFFALYIALKDHINFKGKK